MKERKIKTMLVMMTPAEKQSLRLLAGRIGMNMSQVIRWLIEREVKQCKN